MSQTIHAERRDPHGASDGAVVFLHSLGGTHEDWAAELDLVGADRPAIAFDLPGFGRSPVSETPPSMSGLAQAVLGALDEHGTPRFTLVGLSMGGMVALEIAATAPERINGLVLCSTTSRVGDDIKATLASCGEAIDAAGMAGFADGMVQQIFSPAMLADPSPAVSAYIDTLRASDPEGFKAAAGAIAGHDVEGRIESLACPTLVGHGDRDQLIPLAHGERIAELIPDAELVVFEGSWHMTPFEEADRFRELLSAFLGRARERSAA